MRFYKANLEFFRMKEIFKGDVEWEKALALFHCLSLRDRETAEHSIEVGYYAAKIAEKLGLDTSRLFLAGLLHDIGKISMNDRILKTDGILSKKERQNLKNHVLSGVITLSELSFEHDIVQFCLRHHERLNGSEYPFGVVEADTPIEGKIAQIADVFSALTSERLYRENKKVFSFEEAIKTMKEDSTSFDQEILVILEELIEEFQEKYQYA